MININKINYQNVLFGWGEEEMHIFYKCNFKKIERIRKTNVSQLFFGIYIYIFFQILKFFYLCSRHLIVIVKIKIIFWYENQASSSLNLEALQCKSNIFTHFFSIRVLLTLKLELWQNDVFLILMWNNFTICKIMQLIFRNRSYKNVHYVDYVASIYK